MIILAMLRHGETAWSREGRIQGRSDTDVAPDALAGLSRRRVPASMADWAVLSSPLKRCRQTALALGLQPLQEPRLAEMHWGHWEGARLAELRASLGPAMADNEARGLDFRPEGGESPREVQARLRPLLRDLAAQGRPVLAVSHRGVIRAVFAEATGWDMCGKPPARLDWGALQLFRLEAGGQPSVHRLNLPLEERP